MSWLFKISANCPVTLFSTMIFARSFLNALELKGVKVFPGFAENWHFDDKIAQAMLFEALDIPSPKNTLLFSKEAVESWIKQHGVFPIISKLRAGSGSQNVTLVQNETELRKIAAKMFGSGAAPKPTLIYKAVSNFKYARSWSEIWKRAKRAPEFFYSRKMADKLPTEKNYVYLQDFITCAGYDIRIVVLNNKLSFWGRHIRQGDFRASGGGDLFFDKEIISAEIIKVAFDAADKLGALCIGMDFVVDKATGQPFIIEMSYGFPFASLIKSGGYFDRQGNWHDEPLNAPAEILTTLIHQAQHPQPS